MKFSKSYSEIAPLTGLGIQLAATIVLMFFLGRWLDSEFDAEPLFTLIFTIFGCAAGLYHFIKTVLSYNKQKSDKND